MTDIKATPATDEEIARGIIANCGSAPHDDDCIGAMWPKLKARIAADAEKLRAQDEEIERLRKQNHDSAAKNHTRAQRAEAQLQTLQRDMESAKAWLSKPAKSGALFSRYVEEGIAGFLHTEWCQEAELATLRAQVETLREALKKAIGLCDCSDYNGKALIPCTEANPCAGCCTTRTGQAALAATEPKGEAK